MSAYEQAREAYAAAGADAESALATLATVPLSLHCWQGDDVAGFEKPGGKLEGAGLQVTGSYPGRARDIAELRQDLDVALKLIPTGKPRVNLHAIYGEFEGGRPMRREEINASHFTGWIGWAKARGAGLDFNPTFFSHPLADSGFTLAHADSTIRHFWIDHAIASRRIAAALGKGVGSPAVNNVWIPDGYKDLPIDRKGPRERLLAALDEAFREPIPPEHALDAVESKLFGIGSESYVAGSHEFYLGYAATRRKLLCLDMGHFHPTESVADKVSAVMPFVPGLLLHVSRGVRWDSDHVVLFDDPTRAVFEEVVRGGYLDRTHVGLDYFDASINRVAAWVLGARNTLKCILAALLQPAARLRERESAGDFTARLVGLEESKTLPFGEVWAEHCRRRNCPNDGKWLSEVQSHEQNVQRRR